MSKGKGTENPRERENARRALLAVILISLFGFFIIVRPYLGSILLAFIVAILFSPVYEKLGEKTKLGTTPKVMLVTLLFAAVIIVPIAFLFMSIVSEAPGVIDFINENTGGVLVQEITSKVETFLDEIGIGRDYSGFLAQGAEVFADALTVLLQNLGSWFVSLLSSVINSVIPFVVNLVIFIAVVVSILPRMSEIGDFLEKISPLDPKVTQKFLQKVSGTTKSMVLASFAVAIVNGFIVWLMFIIFGLPFAGIAGFASILFGVIPLLGASIVTVPAAILLIVVEGNWVAGVTILLVHFFVMNNVDLIIRPYFLDEDAKLHPVILAIATLGGIAAFGLLGVIFGPLIVIFLVTGLEIYIPDFYLAEAEGSEEKKDQNALTRLFNRVFRHSTSS